MQTQRMKITEHKIKIKDLFKGYKDSGEDGIVAFDGKLDVRPAYQRNFVYKDKQRDAVIDTVLRGYPLNTMYWSKTKDGTFELLDGQQRTISICEYMNTKFAVNHRYIHNLQSDEREQLENYELMVFVCEGRDSEKLEWFKTINIAGEELTEQELRNAVHTGEWLYHAKKYFSKANCPAKTKAGKYLAGDMNRQKYLETAIKWIAYSQGISIEEYMARHQIDENADELIDYFEDVINWVKSVFTTYRKEMKGIDWGMLYVEYGDKHYNSDKMEERINALMSDNEVTDNKGVYYYVLTGDEKYLNIRVFDKNQRREAYEKQKGICCDCGKHFEIEDMEAHHINPWANGGKTELSNCAMLCKSCHNKRG